MKNQLKRKRKIEILKKNGSKQRSDVELSLPIVSALRELILSGKTIYSKTGFIEYFYVDDEGRKNVKEVSKYTIMSWLSRGNVIPETGETLRDVLERTKQEYRTKKQEEIRKGFLSEADRGLKRMLNLRTNVLVRDKSGNKIIDKDTGEFIRREDHNLLRIKMNTAKLVKERLDQKNWGRTKKLGSKPVAIFSLADLRRVKECENA